jgi:hypothetical protein
MPSPTLVPSASASRDLDLVESAWQDVLDFLPTNLDQLAKEEFGFKRRGDIRSAADVLRICMAYAVLDFSLRSASAWMATHGLGEISDVAVLGRLRRSWKFQARVLTEMMATRLRFASTANFPYRVRIIDGTCVSGPGADGAEWRIHATYDAERGVVDHIEVTDDKGGEHLERAAVQPGDLVVGDRGYAHASRIAAVRQAEGHVLVRIGHNAVPLVDGDGTAFDPLAFARRKRPRGGRPRRIESASVFLRDDGERAYPMRLVLVRKSNESTRLTRKKIAAEASRKGKVAQQRTVDAAAFIFLLTSVPAHDADDVTIAELYRVRWQVELNFKRWKSIFDLDRLRATDPDLARAYIYAKLIAACIADTIARHARAFSPWGVPLAPAHLAADRVG